MKMLLSFLIFFILCAPVTAITLQGSISYTVETARHTAFEHTQKNIDIRQFETLFHDPNFTKNKELLSKNKKLYKNRLIVVFSDNTYGIIYKENPQIGYHYNAKGELQYINLTTGNKYPKKSTLYNRLGVMDSTALHVSKNEQFIFDINKKLVAHWIGNNCYNEKGELIRTRQ